MASCFDAGKAYNGHIVSLLHSLTPSLLSVTHRQLDNNI